VAERFGADAQLLGDEADGAVALASLGRGLVDEPDGSLLQLRWIPPLGRAGPVIVCHGSIILQGMEPPPKSVRFRC
jgi:hypothetical protein